MAETKKPGDIRPFPSSLPERTGKTAVTRPVSVRPSRPYRPPEVTAPVTSVTSAMSATAATAVTSVTRQESIVTDGMKAHRRDIERRKHAAAIERMQQEDAAAASSARFRKFVLWGVLVGISLFGYSRIQILYGNEWPMMETWLSMVLCLGAGFSWLLWYFNKADY